MTISINITLLVLALIGALVFVFVKHGKLAELGKITFICAMFWIAHVLSSGHLRF